MKDEWKDLSRPFLKIGKSALIFEKNTLIVFIRGLNLNLNFI